MYIRDVSGEPRRGTVTELAQRVQAEGSQLVLASDTLAAAQHAHAQGWVDEAALDEVRAQKERDTAFLDAALTGQDDTVATVVQTAAATATPAVVLAERVDVGRRETMSLGASAAYSLLDPHNVRRRADPDKCAALEALARRVAGTWSAT